VTAVASLGALPVPWCHTAGDLPEVVHVGASDLRLHGRPRPVKTHGRPFLGLLAGCRAAGLPPVLRPQLWLLVAGILGPG
jgi:hypothetical protein